jgi:hypothetical protein
VRPVHCLAPVPRDTSCIRSEVACTTVQFKGVSPPFGGAAIDSLALHPCGRMTGEPSDLRRMKRPIPKTISFSVAFVVSLCLNSLVTQLLLVAGHHKVSWGAFIVWAGIYAALTLGLVRGVRISFWCTLLVSVLQLAPAVVWTFADPRALFGAMPWWYPISISVSLLLGLGLLTSLVLRPSRDHFHAQPQLTA